MTRVQLSEPCFAQLASWSLVRDPATFDALLKTSAEMRSLCVGLRHLLLVQDQISRMVRDIAESDSAASECQEVPAASRTQARGAFPWLQPGAATTDVSSSISVPMLQTGDQHNNCQETYHAPAQQQQQHRRSPEAAGSTGTDANCPSGAFPGGAGTCSGMPALFGSVAADVQSNAALSEHSGASELHGEPSLTPPSEPPQHADDSQAATAGQRGCPPVAHGHSYASATPSSQAHTRVTRAADDHSAASTDARAAGYEHAETARSRHNLPYAGSEYASWASDPAQSFSSVVPSMGPSYGAQEGQKPASALDASAASSGTSGYGHHNVWRPDSTATTVLAETATTMATSNTAGLDCSGHSVGAYAGSFTFASHASAGAPRQKTRAELERAYRSEKQALGSLLSASGSEGEYEASSQPHSAAWVGQKDGQERSGSPAGASVTPSELSPGMRDGSVGSTPAVHTDLDDVLTSTFWRS